MIYTNIDDYNKFQNDYKKGEIEILALIEKDFENRISLSSLAVDCDGRFTAYYDDDDMFYGHAVTVYGENGVATSASI